MEKLNLEFCSDGDIGNEAFLYNLSSSTWNEATLEQLANVLLDALSKQGSADTALSMQRFSPWIFPL